MQLTTIEIMGGLGNQLFQIFTLISYSITNKSPFYFSKNSIQQGERKKTYWDTIFLKNLEPFVKSSPNIQDRILPEQGFHFQTLPFYDEGHIRLFGYFQSFKYFQHQQNNILRLLNFSECRENVRSKHLMTFENKIALHFRIGDYIKLPNNYPIMSLNYYIEALTQFLKDTNSQKTYPHQVLFFCEKTDQTYIETHFIIPLKESEYLKDKFTFQCIDHELSDWEQMLTMSLCKYFIIANSTFSWWGAYLSECTKSSDVKPSENYVYYPSTWFGPAMSYNNVLDLFPPHWKKINI